jgi:spermidine/putrescine transport system substrate-binding protein
MAACMRYLLSLVCICVLAGPAAGAGKLRVKQRDAENRFSPALLEKFGAEHDVKIDIVPLDPLEERAYVYDSDRPATAPVDVVVVDDHRLSRYIEKRLLLPTHPAKMSTFANVEPYWQTTFQDPERRFSAPLAWDPIGIKVRRFTYDGPVDSAALLFDPPPSFDWDLNLDMDSVTHMALQYLGHDPCEPGPKGLADLSALLASLKGRTPEGNFGFGIDDLGGRSIEWRSSFLTDMKRAVDDWIIKEYDFGLPKEGFPVEGWHLAVFGDAENPDNARLFQEFVMKPENAAMVSATMLAPSPIAGAADLLGDDVRSLTSVDPDLAAPSLRARTCLYSRYYDEIDKLKD